MKMNLLSRHQFDRKCNVNEIAKVSISKKDAVFVKEIKTEWRNINAHVKLFVLNLQVMFAIIQKVLSLTDNKINT